MPGVLVVPTTMPIGAAIEELSAIGRQRTRRMG